MGSRDKCYRVKNFILFDKAACTNGEKRTSHSYLACCDFL